MTNFLKNFNNQNTNIITDATKKLHPDDLFTNWPFIKQNILGGLSCIFMLLFCNVFKTVLEVKYFNIVVQVQLLTLFVLSLAFFSLTLLLLNKKILFAWVGGFILSSIILFIDKISFNNIYFYIPIIFSGLFFWIASHQYQNTNLTFLKFNWKLIFHSGFIYQFLGTMLVLLAIIIFGYINISKPANDSFKVESFGSNVLSYLSKNNPNSFLNKNFENVVSDFASKNKLMSNFQKQYSVLGLSFNEVLANNIKNIFNSNFDTKAQVSNILIDYFKQASQTVKSIIAGLFLWFILSIIGFIMFISKIFIYYFSQLLIYGFVWMGFFKIKERPATKEDLVL